MKIIINWILLGLCYSILAWTWLVAEIVSLILWDKFYFEHAVECDAYIYKKFKS